jgi:hypothetical protein
VEIHVHLGERDEGEFTVPLFTESAGIPPNGPGSVVGIEYVENARWVGTLTGSIHHTSVIGRFAKDYAEADPEAAMNWVQTTKPKPDNEIIIGVGEIVQTWSENDMAGLGRWLDANRASPVFNQATRDLAVMYADSNRELAKFWGGQNTDRFRREFIAKLLSKPPKPQAPTRAP